MNTFRDLNKNDLYYRLVVDDNGEVSVDSYDITNIKYNKNSYNKTLAQCKTFESVHHYTTNNGSGCTMDEMNIQISDLDKSFTLDGRGYEDIVYMADMECLDEAKILLLRSTISLNKEQLHKIKKDYDEMFYKIIKMNYNLRRLEKPDILDEVLFEIKKYDLSIDEIEELTKQIKSKNNVSL